MDIDRLNAFIDAAQTLNFSETAQLLHVSQPTVSKYIRDLEQSLGVHLFDRSGGGYGLTEARRTIFPPARHLVRGRGNHGRAGHCCPNWRPTISHSTIWISSLRLAMPKPSSPRSGPGLGCRLFRAWPQLTPWRSNASLKCPSWVSTCATKYAWCAVRCQRLTAPKRSFGALSTIPSITIYTVLPVCRDNVKARK